MRWQREVEQRLGLGAETFAVEEEEGAVAADGSADHSPVLVLDQLRDGGGEEVARVQVVVPQEVVQIAMETVGAGLQGRVDDAAGGPSDFGGETVGLHLEFLDRIEVGLREQLAAPGRGDGGAIQHEFPRTGQTAAQAWELIVAALLRPWREQHQLKCVAPAQGQLLDGGLFDHTADGVAFGLDERRFTGHLQRLGHLADLQREVETQLVFDA